MFRFVRYVIWRVWFWCHQADDRRSVCITCKGIWSPRFCSKCFLRDETRHDSLDEMSLEQSCSEKASWLPKWSQTPDHAWFKMGCHDTTASLWLGKTQYCSRSQWYFHEHLLARWPARAGFHFQLRCPQQPASPMPKHHQRATLKQKHCARCCCRDGLSLTTQTSPSSSLLLLPPAEHIKHTIYNVGNVDDWCSSDLASG